jgi:protease PrsW
MGLFALAVAPGIAICLFIYLKDRNNKEPAGLLLVSFLLGMLSTIPAVAIQLLSGLSLENIQGQGIRQTAYFAFIVVALSEELSKFIMVRFYAFKKKAFDEPFDGIVYAVMVSMGFATLENISYVLQYGYATGVLRMFLSVPAHATFGILMGYHMGLAKFDYTDRGRHFLLALLLPILFHGLFDFFLMVGSSLLHIAGALFSFYIAIRLSRKAIRMHRQLSERYNNGEQIDGREHNLF